jgi:hypothetical protein
MPVMKFSVGCFVSAEGFCFVSMIVCVLFVIEWKPSLNLLLYPYSFSPGFTGKAPGTSTNGHRKGNSFCIKYRVYLLIKHYQVQFKFFSFPY